MENATFEELAAVIRANQRFAIGCHVRPDGDAIGSAVAIADSLSAAGKDVVVFNQDGVPDNLAFLPGAGMVRVAGESEKVEVDVMIAVDTATKERLGAEVIEKVSAGIWLNLDHHISNPRYADLNYIDDKSPATGQIVFELIKYMGTPLTATSRDNLFVAISTDTGSFQYPNTTSATYRIGAELIDAGADVGALSQMMYENYPYRRVELIRSLLNVLQVEEGGELASWALSRETTERLGVQPDDSEGLIDMIRSIEGVVVAVFFEELEDGKIRVSMRSKSSAVDVCKICQEFGGGGHSLAAGARLRGPLEEAQERVLEVAKRLIKDAG
ncbi:MAG: bifunctional oligoribonuclease/PAP phosphatase NrnA [Verrucomicrobiales bacterium]|nr:bifunctional oligoribonuclease/PAP phosphatase NrnA [Verrucomicrobiales bacterium]